ncbi:hypothetical protein [Gulosibacter sediminis]|uniref:hypothetical protein n=1 Tax=Gulosibacter sediminis TaxID=1729695 RepID=UPI0024ACBA6E|nr:hypothetical protein [Gulosibacter sediminis]
MKRRIVVPAGLSPAGFSVVDALAQGMSWGQLRGQYWQRPFRGTRSIGATSTLLQKCHAYAPRMGPFEAFSGLTAAAIWGLPMPSRWVAAKHIPEIVVPKSHGRDRTAGLKPRRILDARFERVEHLGLPVVPPLLALLTSCRDLTALEATAMADAMLTGSTNYPGITALELPMATEDEVRDALRQMKRTPGITVLREVLERMRPRVESPKETELRCRLVDAGIPEFEVQPEFVTRTGRVLRPDLGHPPSRTYLDYDGAEHFGDEQKQRDDLTRSRLITAAGARHIRLTKEDLEPGPFSTLVAELRRRIP